MNCPSCGTAVKDDAMFCPSCGIALTGENTATSSAEQAPSSFQIPKYPGAGERSSSNEPNEPSPTYAPPASESQWVNMNTGTGGKLASFGAPLASWWRRFGSMFIDLVIFYIVFAIVGGIVGHGHGSHTHTLARGTRDVLAVIFLIIQGFYFSRLNGLGKAQTVGNKALSISVRDMETGEPIGLKRGFIRWGVRTILYVIFVIPGLINDLFPIWDKKNQSIADKVAKSVVIRL